MIGQFSSKSACILPIFAETLWHLCTRIAAPSSPVQTSISTRLPGCDSFLGSLFSLVCSIRGSTVTVVQRSAVALWGKKLFVLCAMRLVRIQQHTRQQKSETKKCLVIRQDATDFLRLFCIQSRAFAVFVLRSLEHENLQKFCSTQRSLSVPVSLQHRVLIHNSRVRSLFAVCCTHLSRWAV